MIVYATDALLQAVLDIARRAKHASTTTVFARQASKAQEGALAGGGQKRKWERD